MAVVLEGQHSLGYIVAELHDLFSNIPKERSHVAKWLSDALSG